MNELALSLRRILAHAYHILVSAKRDAFRLFDVTLWPLVLFLSMTLFAGAFTSDREVIGMVVLGALGWRIIYHFQMEAVQLYMDNYWMGMIEHVMISPVRWWEFILGGAISAVAKIAVIALLFLGLATRSSTSRSEPGPPPCPGFLACAGCGLVLSIFSMGVAFLKRGDAFAFIFAFPGRGGGAERRVLPGHGVPRPRCGCWPRPCPPPTPSTCSRRPWAWPRGTRCAIPAPWPSGWSWRVLFTTWALAKARRDGKLVKMK